MNPNLDTKSDLTYYSRERRWPSLFPIKEHSLILDIGCGQGNLGLYLKNKYQAHVTGVEIIEDNYLIAKKVLDNAILGDVEKLDLDEYNQKFDYIIFSDSLEHLADHVSALKHIKRTLKPDGKLLISIPNIRNFRVTFPLLFCDSFEYQDEGILDRTHLRFFTRTSISNFLFHSGFYVEDIFYDLPLKSKVGILNVLTFGFFKNLLTSHYFIQACLKKS